MWPGPFDEHARLRSRPHRVRVTTIFAKSLWSFSHDFREPVQQIARLARRGQAAQTTDGAAQTLRQVLECAERAGSMLDGMIEYLAVTEAAETRLAPVDLNACLDQAVDNLSAAISESQAEIRFASAAALWSATSTRWCTCFKISCRTQSNSASRERPVVTIGCEPNGDYWQLAFRDNGIGNSGGVHRTHLRSWQAPAYSRGVSGKRHWSGPVQTYCRAARGPDLV